MKTKSEKQIKLDASDVRSMIKDLSLIVVSLDRIGSTYYNKPKKRMVEKEKYFNKIFIFKLVSRARGILSTAYGEQSLKRDDLGLEEECELLPYWKPPLKKTRKK